MTSDTSDSDRPCDWADRLEAVRRVAATAGPAAAVCELEPCLKGDSAPPPEASQLLTELLLDSGEYERGLARARELQAAHPELPAAWALLADALELSGLTPEALEVVSSAPPEAGLAHRAWTLRQLALPAMHLASEAALAAPRLEAAGSLEQDDGTGEARHNPIARRLLQLFEGHPQAFARQIRLADGKGFGYLPVRRPLELADLDGHLTGKQTLGIYFLDLAGTTRLACWDLDIASRALASATGDTAAFEALRGRARAEARRFLAVCAARGLPVAVEDSGNKGFHFWLFTESVPARELRLLGEWVRIRLGPPPAPLTWEFFPKQDMPGPKGLGNLVKLPLGVHRATGRRSLFLDPATLEPFGDQPSYLGSLRRLSASQIARLLGEVALEAAVSSPARTGPRRQPACDSGELEPESPGLPAGVEPLEAAESSGDGPTEGMVPFEPDTARDDGAPETGLGPGATVRISLPRSIPGAAGRMVSGCGVVAALIGKARVGQKMSPRERHVLLHVTAPLGEPGRLLAHQVMAQLPGYDPDAVHRGLRGVSPTVMGCARVAAHLPHLATREVCRCRFSLPARSYASPTIYAGLHPRLDSSYPAAEGVEEQSGSLEGLLLRRLGQEKSPERAELLRDTLREWRSLLQAEAAGTAPERPRLRLLRPAATKADAQGE